MKTIIYLFLFLNSIVLIAQDSIPELGSEWYYGKISLSSPKVGYDHFIVEKDTIIHEISCRKIVVERYNESNNLTDSYAFGLYRNDNKIYYTYKDRFELLFDYKVQPGDTVKFFIPLDYLEITSYSDSLFIGICESITTIESCDSLLNLFEIRSLNEADYFYTNLLGVNDFYFFPFDSPINDELVYNFRCFHDNSTECINSVCDYTHPDLVGIENIERDQSENISITYTEKQMTINSSSDIQEVEIFDISGRMLFKNENYSGLSATININNLQSKSLYFVKVITSDRKLTQKICLQ